MQQGAPLPSEDEFNPFQPRPLASINRRKIIALPGIPPEWVGRVGWELCSKPTLIRLIQEQAGQLGLASVAAEELPARLNACLASPQAAIRAAAEAIARQHGQRLGAILASLLLSPVGMSDPLSAWEAAYLHYWRTQVRQIHLGGGLANGRLGQLLAETAGETLRTCGVTQLVLHPAHHPSYLPLIGAACRLPLGPAHAAALGDFGGTRGKRGLAFFDGHGALALLRVLPSISTASLVESDRPADLADAMVVALVETIRAVGPGTLLAEEVICAIGAYTHEGRPANYPGASYPQLNQLSPDIKAWFSRRIAAASGRPARLTFVHDCSTAGFAYAGQPGAAALILGTALGIGFAPPAGACRPLAPNFQLEEIE